MVDDAALAEHRFQQTPRWEKAMKTPGWLKTVRTRPFTVAKWTVVAIVVTAAAGALILTRESWLSAATRFLADHPAAPPPTKASLRCLPPYGPQQPGNDDSPDEPDEHDHPGHDEAASLQLSEQAQKNVGLQLVTIEPRDFDRTITVPAMVIERPGHTRIKVSAPMTGIVTRIYPIRGEAVQPTQPLFDLRLTHEDLVDVQSRFLQTVEQLDVIEREVARLKEVTSSGAVAAKRLLEGQYEQQKTEALLHSQQEALMLHGLTGEQVGAIASSRRLLKSVTILAPHGGGGYLRMRYPTTAPEKPVSAAGEHLLQVSKLEVEQGQHVTAGDPLCVLTDQDELYIEGRAFEEDAQALSEAADLGMPITAVVEGNGGGSHSVTGLRILYVENQVDVESRALPFYVRLPNQLLRNEEMADRRRFIGWRYKPGQRVQLLVPVERWKTRIVLPADAVVKEGADWFVFQQNGDHFDRRPVHVEFRDPRWAVIANDGTLSPGDIVVTSGAYQMQLALKNKSGGGVDPHAGHNH
jgi:cobalt-zinc-cadmium efflux system membrane fusion protein